MGLLPFTLLEVPARQHPRAVPRTATWAVLRLAATHGPGGCWKTRIGHDGEFHGTWTSTLLVLADAWPPLLLVTQIQNLRITFSVFPSLTKKILLCLPLLRFHYYLFDFRALLFLTWALLWAPCCSVSLHLSTWVPVSHWDREPVICPWSCHFLLE